MASFIWKPMTKFMFFLQFWNGHWAKLFSFDHGLSNQVAIGKLTFMIYIPIPLVRRLALASQPQVHSSHPTIPERHATIRAENYKQPEKFQNRRGNSFGNWDVWLLDWLDLMRGHKHWNCHRLTDWAEFTICRTIYKSVGLIDWLAKLGPWGYERRYCSTIDWLTESVRPRNSQLGRLKRCERTVLCDAVWTNGKARKKKDSVFFTSNIPKTWHLYPYRAQYSKETPTSAYGGARVKFTCFCIREQNLNPVSRSKSVVIRSGSKFHFQNHIDFDFNGYPSI